MNWQKFMMIGRLTRDPATRHVGADKSVVEFGLACSRKFRTAAGEDKEETLFMDFEAWGKQGEVIAQWCTKGKPLFVEARLRLDVWNDKDTGAKRSAIRGVVENFQFLGSRDQGGEAGDAFGGDQGTRQPQPPARRPAPCRGPADPAMRAGGGGGRDPLFDGGPAGEPSVDGADDVF